MESLNLNSHERELHPLQQMQDKAKKNVQTFTRTTFANLNQLEKHLSKEEFQEFESSSAFRVLLQQFQTFLYSRLSFDNDEGLMIRKYFVAYTKTDVPLFHDKLIQHMESLRESIQERAKHKREYDRRMNDRMMQSKEGNVDSSKALDADLVVTESNKTESERHVSSSRSGKDTHAEDAVINFVNDKQPMAEVKLPAEHNILVNEQQHYEQSESIYDTYLLEKVDRNTTPGSTDMSHRGGEIDQNAVKCQVSCPLLDPSFDNMTTEFLNQSLESENISLKKSVAQLQKYFSRMEAHCVNMELKYQNQALKDRQHVTPYYLPNVRKSAPAKPHHVNAPSSSRNSQKESYGSNDMAHNYYLEEAKKKTQDKNRNLKPREMPSANTHHTPNTYTPKPRSINHKSRNWPASKSKVNSRAKIQPNKTRNSNKLVDPMSHTQKPGRKIITGHSFSPNKSSAVHEKTNTPRSCSRSTLELQSSMAFADNTSGPAPQRKEKCTLQCALSLKEEKSSFAPVPAVSTGSPSSTTVNQDASSPSNSQTTPKTRSPILPNDVEEYNHDLDVAHMNNDPFFGITIPENNYEASSSDVIPTVVQTATPNSEHVTKWTKDHPLDNIIGELERRTPTP
ncbi:hypothetical protein Tco_1403318 [Tanacetum coccineum]